MSAGAAQCPCPYCLAEINGIYLTVHFTAPPVLHSLKLDSLHEKKYSEQEVSLRRPLSLRTQIPIGGSMHDDWRWPVGVRAHPSADLVDGWMQSASGLISLAAPIWRPLSLSSPRGRPARLASCAPSPSLSVALTFSSHDVGGGVHGCE